MQTLAFISLFPARSQQTAPSSPVLTDGHPSQRLLCGVKSGLRWLRSWCWGAHSSLHHAVCPVWRARGRCSSQVPGQGKSSLVILVYCYLVDSESSLLWLPGTQLRASSLSQLQCGLHFGSNFAFWPRFFFSFSLLFPYCLCFFVYLISLCSLDFCKPVILNLSTLIRITQRDSFLKCQCSVPPTLCFNCSGLGPEHKQFPKLPREWLGLRTTA